jgi:polysaccharide export outer membrane protein
MPFKTSPARNGCRLLLLLVLPLCSCVRYRDLVNFREAPPLTDTLERIAQQSELRIQTADLLQITVGAGDSEAGRLAAAPFNPATPANAQGGLFFQQQQQQLGGAGQASYSPELFNGYFVDTEGKVHIPTLGAVKLGGMTLVEAHAHLLQLLEPYLENPGLDIRFLNLKVTLMGEIARPGMLRLSNPRTTVLEAISAAGDLTPFANRRNVLLVREVDGQRSYHRLNLTRNELFASPAFYLRQNDIIYIEPLPIKIAATPDLISRIISYTTAGLSLLTLIIALGR